MLIYEPDAAFSADTHFASLSLYQSFVYKMWQLQYGREVVTQVAEENGKVLAYIQCVPLEVPHIGTLWVAIGGPAGSFPSDTIEEQFFTQLSERCREVKEDTFAIRMRPPSSPYVKTKRAESVESVYTQPMSEQIVFLEDTLEQLEKTFSSSIRRDIKNASKHLQQCETYTEGFQKHFATFYSLLAETATRKKFSLHPKEYYQALFETLDKYTGTGALVVCNDEKGKAITTLLSVRNGNQLYYLFGGSALGDFSYNPSVLAQYKMMEQGYAMGSETYNLGGVAAESSGRLQALSVFKKKFGGATVTHERAHDLVLRPMQYRAFRLTRSVVVRSVHNFFRVKLPKIIQFIIE